MMKDTTEEKHSGDEENQEDEDEDFEIEAIVKAKGKGASKLYLVRWKGYGPEHDLWLPEDGLDSAPDLLKEFKANEEAKARRPLKKRTPPPASISDPESDDEPVSKRGKKARSSSESDAESYRSSSRKKKQSGRGSARKSNASSSSNKRTSRGTEKDRSPIRPLKVQVKNVKELGFIAKSWLDDASDDEDEEKKEKKTRKSKSPELFKSPEHIKAKMSTPPKKTPVPEKESDDQLNTSKSSSNHRIDRDVETLPIYCIKKLTECKNGVHTASVIIDGRHCVETLEDVWARHPNELLSYLLSRHDFAAK
ncbi:unnamed protein product, partial [Mesorhabditis spiculigera]